MSQDASLAAPGDTPLFAWLGRLGRLAEIGTAGYSRPTRRRLTIVNAMALLIAIFSVIYAGVFSYYDMHEYWYLIVLHLLFVIVMILVPLAHRINDIAAALVITAAEYAALFVFVWAFGRNSGIQINYIIAAAVAFAVRCKFTPHEELRRLLLSTGDRNLAEAAPNDYYWGIGKEGTGENRLGLLLMRLRVEFRGQA